MWGILEYVRHVEFIYEFVAQMCDVAAADELAAVNRVDPDVQVDESHFNDVDASEMSVRMRDAGNRARAALDALDVRALDWKLAFNGHPAPLPRLTIAMVHESHHHLRGVARLAAG